LALIARWHCPARRPARRPAQPPASSTQHFRTVLEANGTTQLVMTERARQAVLTQHREASMQQSVKDILDDEFLDYSTAR